MAGRTGTTRLEESSSDSCPSDLGTVVDQPVLGDLASGGNGLALLDENSQAHVLLKHRLYSGLGAAAKHCTVVAAYKDLHSTDSARARLDAFRLYAESVAGKRGGDANIKFAWYGSSADEIDGIIRKGRFSFPDMTEDDGLSLGLGAQLSSESAVIDSVASSNADSNGLRHLLLCRVILGNTEEVRLGSKQCYPSSEEYDSGVDNQRFPKKYIIWPAQLKTHVLPIYALTIKVDFQSKGSRAEPSRKPSSPWITFAALISVISKQLHPSAVCLIKKFHNAYMEKKISRQQLICRVRQLSGDEVLVAAIKSFQAKQRMAAASTQMKRKAL